MKAVNDQITAIIEQNNAFFDSVREPVRDLIDERRKYNEFEKDAAFMLFKGLTNIESMNELYYSRILAYILDPETPAIGNKEYLNIFVDLLRKINPNIKTYKFSDNVKVEREKDRIDIAIYDNVYYNKKKYAIIIENKIKGADDRDRQLAIYYEKVCERGYTPLAVVYLVSRKDKMPATKSYGDKLDDIKPIFVQLLGYDPDGKQLDLAHGFLDECVKIVKDSSEEKDKFASVFIGQFSKLVKYTGGLEAMSAIYEKKIIEAIYSDYKNVEIVNAIAEIWGGRNSQKDQLLGEIIFDKLCKKFPLGKKDEEGGTLTLKTGVDFKFFAGLDGDGVYLYFAKDKTPSNEQQEKLKTLLDDLSVFDSSFFDESKKDGGNRWRYFNHDAYMDAYEKSLDETVEYLVEVIQKTEKEFNKLKL
jgi:hypothetical protein